jgi:hypothetical protein
MESQPLIDDILAKRKKLEEKNIGLEEAKRYRNAEFFFDDIEEDWRQLKISALPLKHPPEVVAFSEEMANYFLDYVDGYFTKVNNNHTVYMSELIRKVASKVDGIAVSQNLKNRIENAVERNHWHGH